MEQNTALLNAIMASKVEPVPIPETQPTSPLVVEVKKPMKLPTADPPSKVSEGATREAWRSSED